MHGVLKKGCLLPVLFAVCACTLQGGEDWDSPVPVRAFPERVVLQEAGPVRVLPAERGDVERAPRPRLEVPDVVLPRRLTAEAAVRLALQHDGGLQALRRSVERRLAEAAPIHHWRDPELRLSYDDTRRPVELEGSDRSSAGDVAVRFFTPHVWSVGAENQAAVLRVEVLRAEERALAWLIECQVKACLLELSHLERKERLLEALEEERFRQKRRQGDLRHAGESRAVNMIRQEIRHVQTADEREQTRSALMRALVRLRQLTGLRKDSAWRIVSLRMSSIAPVSSIGLKEALELALLSRHELVMAELHVRIARKELEAARRKRVPWFDFFQVGYEQRDMRGSDGETWSVQAGVELPLTASMKAGERGVAASALREAEALLERERSGIENQVEETFLMTRRAYERWRKQRAGIARLTSEIERLKREIGESLGGEHPEISQLREKVIVLRLGELDAEYGLRRNVLLLEQVVGARLDPVRSGMSARQPR